MGGLPPGFRPVQIVRCLSEAPLLSTLGGTFFCGWSIQPGKKEEKRRACVGKGLGAMPRGNQSHLGSQNEKGKRSKERTTPQSSYRNNETWVWVKIKTLKDRRFYSMEKEETPKKATRPAFAWLLPKPASGRIQSTWNWLPQPPRKSKGDGFSSSGSDIRTGINPTNWCWIYVNPQLSLCTIIWHG